MKIIISPAKKMRADAEYPAPQGLPVYLDQTQALMERLQSMNYEELKKLWACNDDIASRNVERLRTMDLRGGADSQGSVGSEGGDTNGMCATVP